MKAHVLLLHGYGDHSGRYVDCLSRLATEGFHVHAFDCRGHGQSDGRRAYCESFRQYTGDVETFLDRVKGRAATQKVFAMGHSLGALIVARFLIDKPQGIAGAVFASPYISPSVRVPLSQMMGSKVVGRVVPWLPFRSPLRPTMFSHDLNWQRATDRDPLFVRFMTARWFSESNSARDEVRKRASDLSLPTLLLAAGADPVVSTAASREFFENIGASDKQYREYPGMFHEILNEVDKDQVYADLVGWLSAHA